MRRLPSIAPNSLAPLLLVVCAACASFRGEELPQLEMAPIDETERLPALTYEVRNTVANTPSAPGGWSEGCVDRMLRRTCVDVALKDSEVGLHLDVYCGSRIRQPVFTIGLGLLSLVSLGLIPAYGRTDLDLDVRVEVDGQLVRRYEYQDHVNLWIELFLIPWAFSHDPVEIEQATLENMMLHFLRDFRRDLPDFPRPAAG